MSYIYPGNIVRLKTGGPKMTVERVEEEIAYCVWFDGCKLKRSSFPFVNLNMVQG